MFIERVIRVAESGKPYYWDEPVLFDRPLSDEEYERLCSEILRQRLDSMCRTDMENFRVFMASVRTVRTVDEVLSDKSVDDEVLRVLGDADLTC